MANRSLSNWLPVQTASGVVGTQVEPSAIMSALGAPRDMSGTDVLQVPTLLGADVAQGETLTEDTNDGGKATMYAATFNGKQSLSEREVEVTAKNGSDAFASYDYAWLNKFHMAFDNAALGVSAARSATDSNNRPFSSVYYEVVTNANSMYEAGALTYDNGNELLGRLEGSQYGSGSTVVIFAHPGLKQSLRGIKDSQNRPIFIDGAKVVADTLFDVPVYWTKGAKVTPSHAQVLTGTGNKLMIAVNTQYAAWGQGAAPAHRLIPASMNPLALAHVLQHRAVEGFVLTVPGAASILEVNA